MAKIQYIYALKFKHKKVILCNKYLLTFKTYQSILKKKQTCVYYLYENSSEGKCQSRKQDKELEFENMSSHVIKGISFWTWVPTDGDHMDSCLSSLVLLRSFSVMSSMRRDNLIQPSLGIVMNPAALCEQGWYRCNKRVSDKPDLDGQLTPHHFYVAASS